MHIFILLYYIEEKHSIYYTLTQSVGWRIQTNIAPVSGRALASSDVSGMKVYVQQLAV